jgi:hypothetical protein
MTKPFNEQSFYFCYDCGWGEKGVSEYCISFQQACDIILDCSCKECVERFIKEEDGWFEFRVDRYMISEECFKDEDWEGSQDY